MRKRRNKKNGEIVSITYITKPQRNDMHSKTFLCENESKQKLVN